MNTKSLRNCKCKIDIRITSAAAGRLKTSCRFCDFSANSIDNAITADYNIISDI